MTKEQLIALLNDMSLEEKVNQMSQVIGSQDRWQRWDLPKKISNCPVQ